MTRDSAALHNLADALAESIVAAPGEALLAEDAQERGAAGASAAAFDRIAPSGRGP